MLPTATRSRGAATGSKWRRPLARLAQAGQRLRFKQEELGFNHQTFEYFRNPNVPCIEYYSYGHLLVITGYKWDYTFYKWSYKYL